ncbi:MAG: hypothetical protein D3924_19700, partial [Candidatus Electrothrix sp. AR4]|nr:hypothetical protein [Candidatus Electrothrix sp. AR4]
RSSIIKARLELIHLLPLPLSGQDINHNSMLHFFPQCGNERQVLKYPLSEASLEKGLLEF